MAFKVVLVDFWVGCWITLWFIGYGGAVAIYVHKIVHPADKVVVRWWLGWRERWCRWLGSRGNHSLVSRRFGGWGGGFGGGQINGQSDHVVAEGKGK